MKTVDRARGRWREILPQLGVATRFLSNKHGPCPLCGGKDRYRFDDKNGEGTYYCGQCGPGKGLALVMKANGWDFKTACDEIDKIIGSDDMMTQICPIEPRAKGSRQRLEYMLAEAASPKVVEGYLRARGLHTYPKVLSGHQRLSYSDDGRFLGYFPAMLAPILGADGSLQSVHRTYVGDVPERKKMMKPVDTVNGGAVRLFEPTDELGVAEGIETAIAAHELFNIPTWALLSTNGLDTWEPPKGLSRVLVCGDNDAGFAGQASAYGLAKRLTRTVEAVEVAIPDEVGTDWLDILVQQRARVA